MIMRDGKDHLYEEIRKIIRITYVPADDRGEGKNWAGDVIRIQARKGGNDNALHMGAELPIENPDVFVEMIAALCAVYHEGRSEKKSEIGAHNTEEKGMQLFTDLLHL